MQHVHVANAHSETAYVFVSVKPEYRLLDLAFDFAKAFASRSALSMALAAQELMRQRLTGEFKTVADLYAALSVAAEVLDDVTSTPAAIKAANEYVSSFKEFANEIGPGLVVDVKSTRGWTVSPSALLALSGAKTFNLIVMVGHGRKVVTFDTNWDHSWIVTDPAVVRAKYGYLRVAAPEAGKHVWEGVDHSKRPLAEHGGFLWCVKNETNAQLVFQYSAGRSGLSETTSREGTFGSGDPAYFRFS